MEFLGGSGIGIKTGFAAGIVYSVSFVYESVFLVQNSFKYRKTC